MYISEEYPIYIEMANCRLVANRVYTLSGRTSPRYVETLLRL